MIPEAVVLSFVIGLIRGGKLANLAALPLRMAWLIIVPGVLLVGLWIAKAQGIGVAGAIAHYFHLITYVFLLVALLCNIGLRGIWLTILGTALNFASILANGGNMPVSVDAARTAGMFKLAKMLVAGHNLIRHVMMSEHTHLNFLGDIIPVPRPPFPFPAVISVGDILVSIGLFIVVQYAMIGRPLRKPASAGG